MLPNSEGSTHRGQVHVKCLHTQDDQQSTSSSQYKVTSFIFVFVNYKWEALRTKFSSSPPLSDSFPTEVSYTASRSSKNRFILPWSLWIISWIVKYISTSLITLIKMIIITCSPSLIGDCAISSRRWSSLCFLVCVLHTQLGGDWYHHFQRWCRWRNYKLSGLMILVFDCVWIGYCQCNWLKQYDVWSFDVKYLLSLNLWLAYV